MELVSGQMSAKKVAPACRDWGRGAVLSCPTEMQRGCVDLIHNFVLTPLQNFKICPGKSLLLIQPVYVKLQTQRFSTGAGNAGTEPFIYLHKMLFQNQLEKNSLCRSMDMSLLLGHG